MCTRFGNVIHVYMHTEVAYKYIYSGHAHTANGWVHETCYEVFFSGNGPVLDAASSLKATTTYPTRMRLAAAIAEMAANVVEPT